MASKVGIINAALTLLGESRIISVDQDVKQAREAKAIYDITLDALLAKYTWSFTKKRLTMTALTTAPDHGYSYEYQLPADCLRVVMVGEYYAGLDLTDYRGAPTEMFTIEGRKILTDIGPALPIQHVAREVDPAMFAPAFVEALSTRLAELLAEPLTQSDTKRARAETAHRRAVNDAIRTNAIELPPRKLPDDEWLMARL